MAAPQLIVKQLQAVPNVRDLSEAFPAIPPGRLLRCANPSPASPADTQRLLEELRVRDLIDLRSGEEMHEDDPGSVLMGMAATRQYVRSWLRPSQVYALPDQPPQPPTPSQPSNPAPPAASNSPPDASSPPSTTASPPDPPAASPSQSAPASSSPTVTRHHISLLERGRYYAALAARLPPATTAAALLTSLVNRPAGRALLLPYVNGGGLRVLYEMLLESAKPEMGAVMGVLLRAAEAQHGVLFFCRAGKDRTGLVAAAVLSVAGASEEEIVADYARSDAYHSVALAGLEKREELAGLDRAQFERAPPEVMRDTLAHVRRRYGSFPAYLTAAGFGPEQQRRLRELLTAPW